MPPVGRGASLRSSDLIHGRLRRRLEPLGRAWERGSRLHRCRYGAYQAAPSNRGRIVSVTIRTCAARRHPATAPRCADGTRPAGVGDAGWCRIRSTQELHRAGGEHAGVGSASGTYDQRAGSGQRTRRWQPVLRSAGVGGQRSGDVGASARSSRRPSSGEGRCRRWFRGFDHGRASRTGLTRTLPVDEVVGDRGSDIYALLKRSGRARGRGGSGGAGEREPAAAKWRCEIPHLRSTILRTLESPPDLLTPERTRRAVRIGAQGFKRASSFSGRRCPSCASGRWNRPAAERAPGSRSCDRVGGAAGAR